MKFIFNEFDDIIIFDSERDICLEVFNRFQGTYSLNILEWVLLMIPNSSNIYAKNIFAISTIMKQKCEQLLGPLVKCAEDSSPDFWNKPIRKF